MHSHRAAGLVRGLPIYLPRKRLSQVAARGGLEAFPKVVRAEDEFALQKGLQNLAALVAIEKLRNPGVLGAHLLFVLGKALGARGKNGQVYIHQNLSIRQLRLRVVLGVHDELLHQCDHLRARQIRQTGEPSEPNRGRPSDRPTPDLLEKIIK